MHVHRGHDARDLVGCQMVRSLLFLCDMRSLNMSHHLKRNGAGRDVRTTHTTWCSPHLHQILCRVAFYEEI